MPNGQSDINAAPGGTTFCLTGTHNWTLTPKSGDKFIGPAVLDGAHATVFAIRGNGTSNVVLSALEVRNYRVADPDAAIAGHGTTGWIFRDLRVHDNGTIGGGGAGAHLGVNSKVVGGRYYNNRELGNRRRRRRQRLDHHRRGDRPQQLHRRHVHDPEHRLRVSGRRREVDRRQHDDPELEDPRQRVQGIVGRPERRPREDPQQQRVRELGRGDLRRDQLGRDRHRQHRDRQRAAQLQRRRARVARGCGAAASRSRARTTPWSRTTH